MSDMGQNVSRRNNIELRAARYFGMERDPRMSIKVSRRKVLLVRPHGNSRALAIYSEEGNEPKGEYVYLDGDKPDLLRAAL